MRLGFLCRERRSEKPGYLFVLPWNLAKVGGVNQVVYRLFHRASHGHDVRPLLLTTSWDSPPNDSRLPIESQHHLRLRGLPDSAWRLKQLAGFLLTLPNALWKLVRFLRTERVCVVNPHFPTLICIHFALLKRLGLFRGSLVFALHGAELNLAVKSHGVVRVLWKFLLRSADAITTCSRSLASTAIEFDQALESKVKVVHNGTDELGKQALGPNGSDVLTPFPTRGLTVLSIGKFEHKKGQDVLIAGFKRLLADRPELRLVLVGATGPSLDEIRQIVAAEGLEDRVRLHVDVPHQFIWRFFAEASVFVLSSRSEPFGIVLLEAGLAGVPVVATNVGGIPEILSDGVNGKLVPCDDPAAIACAVAELLDRPDEANRLAKQLRDDVLDKFSWERCYQGYLGAAGVVAEGPPMQPTLARA
jgi:glycosyltransferase involved in cell wall biosynthesis